MSKVDKLLSIYEFENKNLENKRNHIAIRKSQSYDKNIKSSKQLTV